MAGEGHGNVSDLVEFTDAEQAVARITEIYDRSTGIIRTEFEKAATGRPPDAEALKTACYPYVGIAVGAEEISPENRLSYGALNDPGVYGTTVTQPALFADYFVSQIRHVLDNHQAPVVVGLSDRRIPLPFVVEDATAGVTSEDVRRFSAHFAMPDLAATSDGIANGTHLTATGEPYPLALFPAERVDYSVHRLGHYSATSAKYFQRFVFFTNYQRYVDELVEYGREQVHSGDQYAALVEPGDVVTPNPRFGDMKASGEAPAHLPQMPAYHLVRPDHTGITLVNIGVGPSNAKTATDHIAVLRPHCWLMLGHCAGLRHSQLLGDYVLAHGYVREDHVLDQDLPLWAPVPPIAEVQVALQDAVASITGLHGTELKTRMRTGTVASTDNRNWELRFDELFQRLSQARAIAVDMESAAIAANGFRFRVPYGTLLCVSDKPIHGEIKLRGMANIMYQERVSQHLRIGLEAVRLIGEAGVGQLHSRKLRSFDEPAFR